MGFRHVRGLLIDALRDGRYQHESRADIEAKNLLAVGDVSPAFVVRLLQQCGGGQYTSSAHHFDGSIVCHEFKPVVGSERWYVKAYLISVDAVFIGVHR